jgi:hypothetical protein
MRASVLNMQRHVVGAVVLGLLGCTGTRPGDHHGLLSEQPQSMVPTESAQPVQRMVAGADEIQQVLRETPARAVLTFVGYSAAEYEDVAAMRVRAREVLGRFDPATTVVNAGATAPGIGAVYALAKEKGFRTIGIVSILASKEHVPLSPDVDAVFYVNDTTWGGLMPGTSRLSPTSSAIVAVSDKLVGIGGGEAARDELVAARAAGKDVEFIPADLNHQIARAKAQKQHAPAPIDFRGAAHAAMLGGA